MKERYRVTAEMLEAGRQAIRDRGNAWEKQTMASIYRAMRELAPMPQTETVDND